MTSAVRYLRRSLVGPLALLAIGFIIVPFAVYLTFQQADQERQDLLISTVRAQVHTLAAAVAPYLGKSDRTTFVDADTQLNRFTIGKARVRLLFRPSKVGGVDGFYLIAAAPRIDPGMIDRERKELIDQGVLDDFAFSCSSGRTLAKRFREPSTGEEYLAAVAPVSTEVGCWAVVFSYPSQDLLGSASTMPYWQRLELRRAGLVYLGLAAITLLVFLTIRRNVLQFGGLARGLRLGSTRERSFAEQNELTELDGVADELDRMVATLRQSADSIRRRAEDNVDAFKTPIAVMRQSLEPLHRIVPEGDIRLRRAVEVIEQAVNRLDKLVDDARSRDEAAAELIDPPRQPINLSRLLDRIAKGYRELAAKHGVVFATQLSEGLVVLGSEGLIQTAVEAVLDNAMGFCPAGGRVELHLLRNVSRAEIAVANNGPDIPAEYSHLIFERGFSKRTSADGSTENKPHGGIGLWAARRNLQALGGGIIAQNLPEEGVLMLIDLPLVGAPPSARQLRRIWILGSLHRKEERRE